MAQTVSYGGKNTRTKIEGKSFRHVRRPPSPANTVNQITPDLETSPDSLSSGSALVADKGFHAKLARAPKGRGFLPVIVAHENRS
jgi:hypothetical protein